MMLLFITVWVSWFLSEIWLNVYMRATKVDAGNHDKHSILWIWVIVLSSIGLAVMAVNLLYLPIDPTGWVRFAGLAVILAGMAIRFAAIRTLGKFFTVNLALHNDHRLIRSGLFRVIRHPSYTGLLVSFFGLGLTLNNWLSLAAVFTPIFLIVLKRISLEEKMLTEQFGQEYQTYKKSTWRLFPGII